MLTIPLTQGYFTKVDDDDYKKYAIYRWYTGIIRGKPRAIRKIRVNGKSKSVYLSRVIINAPIDKYIDHINGDTLDNRRANLRFCTNSENLMNQSRPKNNTSGYKGVSFERRYGKKWRATITTKNKQYFLGYFLTKEEAANAYDENAIKYFGKFAKLNFRRT